MAKKVVNYIPGIVSGKKGKPITTQQDAWKEDADCGCGIDCCEQKLVLTDRTTKLPVDLYFEDGSLFVVIDGDTYEIALDSVG